MVTDLIYLGRVWEPITTRDGYRFAHVEPILQSSSDLCMWDGRVQEPAREFPQRGRIFWHDTPAVVQKASYWQFRITESPSYDGADKAERYQVEDAMHPVEVIDFRGWEDRDALRRLLTRDGVELGQTPLGREVLLWVDDELWIGPLTLNNASGLWKIGPSMNLARLPKRRAPGGGAYAVNLDGRRWLLNPAGDAGEQLGFCNWMGDMEFAKGLLRRLRKLDSQAFDGLRISKAVFDAYLTAMEHAGLIGSDLLQELGRKERIATLAEVIRANEDLLNEAVSALLGSPVVQEELQTWKAAEYGLIRDQIRGAVEEELSSQHEELGRLKADVEREQTTLRALQNQIDLKDAELQGIVDSFDDELMQRLDRLREKPEAMFAEVAVLRAVFGTPSGRRIDGRDRTPPAPMTPQPVCRPLTDQAEFTRVLAANLKARSVPPLLATELHLAFISGCVPLLVGGCAFDALRAYADTIAGGGILWIPVSASLFEPNALLGYLDVPTRRILPHAGGLLDLFAEAAESDLIYVVALEGLNRAPVESYLLPLLESRWDAWQSGPVRRIPLAADRAVDPLDPYREMLRVAWPANVIVAALPQFGPAALPLPDAIWRYAVLINCDGVIEVPSQNDPMQGETATMNQGQSRVGYSQWVTWGRWPGDGAHDVLASMLQRLDLDHGVQRAARSVYQAARSSGFRHESALQLTGKLSVVPGLADDRIESFEQLLAAEGVRLDGDIAAIRDLARKLVDWQ